jgi:hypothetical protein
MFRSLTVSLALLGLVILYFCRKIRDILFLVRVLYRRLIKIGNRNEDIFGCKMCDMIFINCNSVSTRWYWSVKLYSN